MGAPEGNPGIEAEQKVCGDITPVLGPSERTCPEERGARALRPGQKAYNTKIKKRGGVLKRKVKGGHPKKKKERGHRVKQRRERACKDPVESGRERPGGVPDIGGSHRPKKKRKKKKKIHTEDVPVWQHTGSTWRGRRFEEGRIARSSRHGVEKGVKGGSPQGRGGREGGLLRLRRGDTEGTSATRAPPACPQERTGWFGDVPIQGGRKWRWRR